MAEFDAWAPYYDLAHPGLPGEAEFYALRGAQCGGEVLELGCGTGRIAIPMAMSGAQVTGIDLSRGMLRVCRLKLREMSPIKGALTLSQRDMRAFSLGREFRLIMAPYRTLMHLLNSQDQVRCLNCVRKHMAPTSRFLFNVWAARPSALVRLQRMARPEKMRLIKKHKIPENGYVLRQYYAAALDETQQRMTERHRFEHVSPEGIVTHADDLSMIRTWFSLREMEHLLARCGLRIEELLGDYAGSAFGGDSSEMIISVKRAD